MANSSFFQTSGTSSTTETNIQTEVDAAEAAKIAAQAAQAAAETAEANAETAEANSETAQAASEAARDLALSYRDTAETHKNASETAKTGSETAQTASEAARDLSQTYRNTAQNHRDDAEKLATNPEDSQFTLSDGSTTGYSALHYAAKAEDEKTAAAASATSAASSLSSFQDQYRTGTTDPTTDLDAGDLFYNQTSGVLKVYTGTAWEQGVTAGSGFLPLTGGGLTGNLTTTGLIDGRDVAADGTKLDGIESGATADQTASEILTAVKTVDGASSGLDADLLDGQHGSYYTSYTDTAVANLVDSAPGTLDTLNELAAALGDDANFSTTVTNSIATKLPLAGGTLTGKLTVSSSTGEGILVSNTSASGNSQIKLDGATDFQIGTGQASSGFANKLFFYDATNAATRMTIDSSGIDVTGNVTADGLTVDASSGGLTFSGGGSTFISATSSPLIFKTSSGTERMRITGTGSVGIGTDSPGGLAEFYKAGTSEVLIGTDNGGTAQLSLYETDDGTKEGLLKYDGTNNRIHLATSGAPNALVIPRDSGRVCIGGTSPSQKFVVTNAGADNIVMCENSSASIQMFMQATSGRGSVGTFTNHDVQFLSNNTERMRLVASSGDLHVDGNVIAYSTTISDPRLKENIEPLTDALTKVEKLNGYTFTYKADGVASAGVMSTEVREVLPSAIKQSKLPLKTGEDNETLYDIVQYDQLHALLIEAVKELSARVKELENASAN